MAESLAWFLGATTILLWFLYKLSYDRSKRLERTVEELQKTIASDAALKTLKDQRIETLTQLAQQHEARAAMLAGDNVRLEDEIIELSRPPIYHLPTVGSTVTTN